MSGYDEYDRCVVAAGQFGIYSHCGITMENAREGGRVSARRVKK